MKKIAAGTKISLAASVSLGTATVSRAPSTTEIKTSQSRMISQCMTNLTSQFKTRLNADATAIGPRVDFIEDNYKL
jgi:hypothetical protein